MGIGMAGNVFILGGQVDEVKKDLGEVKKDLGKRIDDVAADVKRLTKNQDDMAKADMSWAR